MARYIVTRAAEEDVNEILAFIAADNFAAAITFDDRLLELFRMLSDNPNAGRVRSELQDGLRCFPEQNYIIFYRKWDGKIAITRVIHSSRDLDEIFS